MYLRVGECPILELNGKKLPLTASPPLTKEIWRKLVYSFLSSEQINTLVERKSLDVPVELADVGTFRAKISVQGETFDLSILNDGGTAATASPAGPAPLAAPTAGAPGTPKPVPLARAAAAPLPSHRGGNGASPPPAANEEQEAVSDADVQTPLPAAEHLAEAAAGPAPVAAAHPYRPQDVTIDELLSILLDKGASDLHLHEQKKPLLRVDGRLVICDERVIDRHNLMAMVEQVTSPEERGVLFERRDLDTSYNLKSLSRFRVNILCDTRGWGMVLRVIPFKIPKWTDLGVPRHARDLIYKPHGLFLVTGPTGSGKSTTLASLIADVNHSEYKHIITIEDPIEFIHEDAKSCITQREVGIDTRSFADGVVDVLRQDPDLILVGEMRDMETMSNALLAAEAGRLVLATLHTTSASQTVERIINVFPEDHQGVARSQLANSLVGILSQTLLPKKNGGRIAAFEVMIATESVRNLIKENKPQMLQTSIETGARAGMKSLDQHLLELVEGGQVTFEDAYSKCQNSKNFKSLEQKLKGTVSVSSDE